MQSHAFRTDSERFATPAATLHSVWQTSQCWHSDRSEESVRNEAKQHRVKPSKAVRVNGNRNRNFDKKLLPNDTCIYR